MLRTALIISGISLAVPSLALAGPMPALPELPPLQTHFEVQPNQQVHASSAGEYDDVDSASGVYGGILTGYSAGRDHGLGLALIVGNTVAAADLLLGVEAIGFAATTGEVSIEGDLRAGFSVNDNVSVFANAGLGYSFDTDVFVSTGGSLEADIGGGWIARSDYRYNHDLSGDAGTHRVLAGLLHIF